MSRLRPLPYPHECGKPVEMQRPSSLVEHGRTPMRGAGDLVAAGIKMATFGLVEPCESCEERRRRLNAWMPFGSASE